MGNAQVIAQNVSNTTTGGRPPQPPRHHVVGQYRGQQRGGRGEQGGGRGGRNTSGPSSSRPSKRTVRGIGVRDPNVETEPFLNTYVPGPTSSTPAFAIPPVRSGPTINSDAEDPHARKHKRLRRNRTQGRTVVELRNENSEVEGHQTSDGGDDEEELGGRDSEGDYNMDDRDCDEAPADDDVVIRDANIAGPSTQEVRRSSRLNN